MKKKLCRLSSIVWLAAKNFRQSLLSTTISVHDVECAVYLKVNMDISAEIKLESVVVLKSGNKAKVTGLVYKYPWQVEDYVYGRTIPHNTFIVIKRSDVTEISNPKQGRLFV
jgi:hypothetical protein